MKKCTFFLHLFYIYNVLVRMLQYQKKTSNFFLPLKTWQKCSQTLTHNQSKFFSILQIGPKPAQISNIFHRNFPPWDFLVVCMYFVSIEPEVQILKVIETHPCMSGLLTKTKLIYGIYFFWSVLLSESTNDGIEIACSNFI